MRFNRVFARFFCRMRAAKICVVWGAAMRVRRLVSGWRAAASVLTLFAASMIAGVCNGQVTGGLQPTDYQRMRTVAQAEFSRTANSSRTRWCAMTVPDGRGRSCGSGTSPQPNRRVSAAKMTWRAAPSGRQMDAGSHTMARPRASREWRLRIPMDRAQHF